jgi:hypothetical protein
MRMTTNDRRGRLRLGALATIVVLAVVPAGCGGEDDDPSARGDAPKTAGSGNPGDPERGSAEWDIVSRYAGFVDFVGFESAPGVCSRMTRNLMKDLGGGNARACTRRVERLFAAKRIPAGDRKVLEVDANGAHATAKVKSARGGTHTVRFAREKQEWKIDGGEIWR